MNYSLAVIGPSGQHRCAVHGQRPLQFIQVQLGSGPHEGDRIDSGTLSVQKMCLRNLFLIGMVGNRNSPQCSFSQYILLALSVMMVSTIPPGFGAPLVPPSSLAEVDKLSSQPSRLSPCWSQDGLMMMMDLCPAGRFHSMGHLVSPRSLHSPPPESY